MAICNIFKKLTKETGTFLTFSQYMNDLTEWQAKSGHHKIVPSKFIAIDCNNPNYNNITLPRLFQEGFENACSCFRNVKSNWTSEDSKTLFWNMMLGLEGTLNDDDDVDPMGVDNGVPGLIGIPDIRYVGDINLQSYNEVDGMGYSEIYCHIPNDASAYKYDCYKTLTGSSIIQKHQGDLLEGLMEGELNGLEKLSQDYTYDLKYKYTFSWEDNDQHLEKLDCKSFNINMVVVLYDIWNNDSLIYSQIPMGIYITGLIDTKGCIQNNITKYVNNEDIYNSGTSYGLRICSRYVVSPNSDNYIVKEITCEDNNYGDLSRVLSQLSISQTKMDEVMNKVYNNDQNYKNLLSIFKNSRTNVPYIKIVNGQSCWFVNGKLIGPSIADDAYDAYSEKELDELFGKELSQSFQIVAVAQDSHGKRVFEKGKPVEITLSWDVYYDGKKVTPSRLEINGKNYSNTNQFREELSDKKDYKLSAEYGDMIASTTITVPFMDPIYFGEVFVDNINSITSEDITSMVKYISTSQENSYKITTSKDPGYICYAYPESLGKLSYIYDSTSYMYYMDGLDNNDFEYTIKDVLINGEYIKYYVYKMTNKVSLVDYVFKFKKLENKEN